MGASIGAQQQAYTALFGFTGFDPLPGPVDKKAEKKAAPADKK